MNKQIICKVFRNFSCEDIEKKINDWLLDSKITDQDIVWFNQFVDEDDYYITTIFYKEHK